MDYNKSDFGRDTLAMQAAMERAMDNERRKASMERNSYDGGNVPWSRLSTKQKLIAVSAPFIIGFIVWLFC